jgi:cob(I)alamin adenosyltransferase
VKAKLYTRAGDKGITGLAAGGRIPKDSPVMHALGSVDELNSAVGLAAVHFEEARAVLEKVQDDLFTLGAELAAAKARTRIGARHVEWLEQITDATGYKLGSIEGFVLPGGSDAAAFLHFARTVARRAERDVVTLSRKRKLNPEALRYLNRLSSLLYAMALLANERARIGEKHPTYV